MIILKRVLPSAPHLRLILMSATLHIDLYSGYFGGCPVIHVPGRMHPVEDLFLEDCLKLTGYQDALAAQRAQRGVRRSTSTGTATMLEGFVSGVDYSGGIGGRRGRRGRGDGDVAMEEDGMDIHPEERLRAESAIMEAFVQGSDEAFEELLDATGSVGADDVREGAPCVNVKHPQTGVR